MGAYYHASIRKVELFEEKCEGNKPNLFRINLIIANPLFMPR